MFRIVFWDVLPCKMIVDQRQYIPEDNSEHHTRRRENLKSHIIAALNFENHENFWRKNYLMPVDGMLLFYLEV
jgi:hypothetical protein